MPVSQALGLPNPTLAALAEQQSGAAPRQNTLARNKDRSAAPMTQVMRSRDLENCDQSVPLPLGRKHVKGDGQVFVVRSADYYLTLNENTTRVAETSHHL